MSRETDIHKAYAQLTAFADRGRPVTGNDIWQLDGSDPLDIKDRVIGKAVIVDVPIGNIPKFGGISEGGPTTHTGIGTIRVAHTTLPSGWSPLSLSTIVWWYGTKGRHSAHAFWDMAPADLPSLHPRDVLGPHEDTGPGHVNSSLQRLAAIAVTQRTHECPPDTEAYHAQVIGSLAQHDLFCMLSPVDTNPTEQLVRLSRANA